MALFHPGVTTFQITSVVGAAATLEHDELCVEEPLEIRVSILGEERCTQRSIAVTMRTPGNDIELAAGFLLTEGIVRSLNEIANIRQTAGNIVLATLVQGARLDPATLDRHSFVASSCGVCGKRSIAAVFALQPHTLRLGEPRIASHVIHALPTKLRAAQATFNRTGGLHAAALFDSAGELLLMREDVGRHNALDKLIGAELVGNRIPLESRLLLVSGGASFELIQKAAVAGIPVLAAVGAPSSLAVTLARQTAMSLLGFVRDGRFNVYADAGRMADGRQDLNPAPATAFSMAHRE